MTTDDAVTIYARSIGVRVASRIVLVEGRTDADLIQLAAELEFNKSGQQLLGADLAISAAGTGDEGGCKGVVREFLYLRGNSRTCLLPNGRLKYRIIALLDNDPAGKEALRNLKATDSAILEYRDVFRLWHTLPFTRNLDPAGLGKVIESANEPYRKLDCEIEDFVAPTFIDSFLSDHTNALRIPKVSIGDHSHWEFTNDGKARLHRFIKQHAMVQDLEPLIDVLRALRGYLGLPIEAITQ